ncbi:MAG: hypothetical protein WC539_10180 [Nitrospirota bacterium]
MQKFLLICNDVIGANMAGPGIRALEIARALNRMHCQVAVLARQFEDGFSDQGIVFLGRASFWNLLRWIRRMDSIIMPGRPLSVFLGLLFRKKVIFDQYDPVIFELLEMPAASRNDIIRKKLLLCLWKIRQRIILRFGDAFLVANERQRDFLISQMILLGHHDKLHKIIILPFGLPDTEPIKTKPVLRGTTIQQNDFLLVWGGGIWGWFDPFILLEALSTIRKNRSDIKVYFPGLKPPSADAGMMTVHERFLSEARNRDLLDTMIFVNDAWTSYAERGNYLLEADAGISLHKESLETRFAFRTRMLDYVWAGLPIIASQGDSWAEIIEKRNLGITILPGDVDALVAAILRMADDRAFREACRERVKDAAHEYTWSALTKKLITL